jgi:hypothetical protein
VILNAVASPCVGATGTGRSTGVPTFGAPGSSSQARMLSAAAVGERLGLDLDFDFDFDFDFDVGSDLGLAFVRERSTVFDPLDFVPTGLRLVVLATLSLLQES